MLSLSPQCPFATAIIAGLAISAPRVLIFLPGMLLVMAGRKTPHPPPRGDDHQPVAVTG